MNQPNTTDPLSTETVVGSADNDSQQGQKRRDAHKVALDAKERGDLDGIFAAYRTAVEERAEAEDMWLRTLVMLRKKDSLETSPIEAIRDVALAAIQLAEKVALMREGPNVKGP